MWPEVAIACFVIEGFTDIPPLKPVFENFRRSRDQPVDGKNIETVKILVRESNQSNLVFFVPRPHKLRGIVDSVDDNIVVLS